VQSLYSDTSLVAVLELSMGLFILWILSLITVYTTNLICINFASRKVNSNEAGMNNMYQPFNSVIGNVIDRNYRYYAYNTTSNEYVFLSAGMLIVLPLGSV
jgi:hypothetical protein